MTPLACGSPLDLTFTPDIVRLLERRLTSQQALSGGCRFGTHCRQEGG